MDPSTNTAAEQGARDEELRGKCAKAFAHYKKGNLTRGTDLVKKLLARHPAHPVLHFAHVRLSHLRALEQRQSAGVVHQFRECCEGVVAAAKACPNSLLVRLFVTQVFYDFPIPNDQVDEDLDFLRKLAAAAAKMPLAAADLEYAKAIATFDEDVYTLALLQDVPYCRCGQGFLYGDRTCTGTHLRFSSDRAETTSG